MAERAELRELLNIGRTRNVKTRPAKVKRTLFMTKASNGPRKKTRWTGCWIAIPILFNTGNGGGLRGCVGGLRSVRSIGAKKKRN